MKLPLFIARQSRQPQGLLGRLVGRVMAAETSAENHAAIDLLEPQNGETILDIGCGPGVAVAEMARRNPACRILGLDPSATILDIARKRCAKRQHALFLAVPGDGARLHHQRAETGRPPGSGLSTGGRSPARREIPRAGLSLSHRGRNSYVSIPGRLRDRAGEASRPQRQRNAVARGVASARALTAPVFWRLWPD